MRSTRSFFLLALATVGVVLATLYVQYESQEPVEEKALLFPMLAQRLNEAAELRIERGEFSVTLRRQGKNAWQVRERGNYPAGRARIHALLLGSAGLERLEEKTRNPGHYGRLGLAEAVGEGEEDQLATRVAIRDGEGHSLATFFVGRRGKAKGRTGRGTLFVRLPDDPAAWLVAGNLPQGNEVSDWLRKDILTLDRARIRAARITHPNGETITVEKTDPDDLDSRIASMANLELEDVSRLEAVDLSTKSPGATVLITTFDGMRITMSTWQSQDKVLLRLDADFDPEPVLPGPSGHGGIGDIGDIGMGTRFAGESGNRGLRSMNRKGRTHANAVKKEAARLAERWRDWVYILPGHSMEYLARRTRAKRTKDLME